MFRRRTTSSSNDLDNATSDVAPGGKGRATPTRKEAEAARKQRLTAPRTRKEQQAVRKAQLAQSRARQRQALSTGDDTYLPARDKGPVRRYVRDFVDSKWRVGEILVPLFFVVFVILAVAPATVSALGVYVWLAVLVLMGVDAVRVVRGVKAGIRERFGEAETQGVAMYAVLRALQMRRLRLPKPLVKHGQSF
jgi:Flp pilus assembly protein TadB